MWVFEGYSANEFYRDMIETLQEHGEEIAPRGLPTQELLHVVTRIHKPQCRVLTQPGRKLNPFFNMAETVWILAGHANAEWICFYNSQLKKYLDPPGKYFHGAYGERLRRWGTSSRLSLAASRYQPFEVGAQWVDQLRCCFQVLSAHSDSRQAVMVLWNPWLDYNSVGSLDLPCLAGDTPLWSPEGDLPIAAVAEKFTNGEIRRWPVFIVNPSTKKLRLGWATRVWRSGVRRTVRITFDDGSCLRMTRDHAVYVWVRESWERPAPGRPALPKRIEVRQAGDLQPGDRVFATQRWVGPKGHLWVKRNLDYNTGFENRQFIHTEYATLLWGPIPQRHDVHHHNEVKADNRSENLVVIPHGKHAALKMFGSQNPHCRMSLEERAARGRKHSVSLKQAWANPQKRQRLYAGVVAGNRIWRQRKALLRWEKKSVSSQENHMVISVEDCGEEEVYDFAVEGREHTALVGTGVVVHNCNIAATFKLRQGKLWMSVFNRSNDVILGLTSTNIVQFSTIQEVLASWLGVGVGPYTHYSDSLHLYCQQVEGVEGKGTFNVYDHVSPQAMARVSPEVFDSKIVTRLISTDFSEGPPTGVWIPQCPYWDSVAWALYAYNVYKAGAWRIALEAVRCMSAQDWKIECLRFLADRLVPKFGEAHTRIVRILREMEERDLFLAGGRSYDAVLKYVMQSSL